MSAPIDSEIKEYQESTTITFEWTVRGLKQLFDSSKGDTKSKVTKSAKFGGGRWQILLYPNSGHEGGYVSLYLSCEPTQEEKENAVNGKWVREGLFKFSFDLKSITKPAPLVFNTKEACDHAFSWKTMNWGWAQFAKRDAVYYGAPAVRNADVFLIVCTITSSPGPPRLPSAIPRQFVPRSLMDAVGSMLDDPTYSDVEFVLPSRGGRSARRIYASKKIISRAEYFASMFNSGFAEASHDGSNMMLDITKDDSMPYTSGGLAESVESLVALDDSDDSDAETETDPTTPGHSSLSFSAALLSERNRERQVDTDTESDTGVMVSANGVEEEGSGDLAQRNLTDAEDSDSNDTFLPAIDTAGDQMAKAAAKEHVPVTMNLTARNTTGPAHVPGPSKTTVVVKDTAYATYMAFLYYLYTDSIVFAPLSSNFMEGSVAPPLVSGPVTPAVLGNPTQLSYFSSSAPIGPLLPGLNPPSLNMGSRPRSALGGGNAMQPNDDGAPTTRREWVKEWTVTNPGRPGPVSAKAIYRLADKLNLQDLKQRAFQHIVKGLTVQNIPYEVFSSFSAAFEEVRRVEVEFFLNHWAQIKGGDAMKNVFHQIRLGRHPGFDEIWPLIVVNLEYKPRSLETGGAAGVGVGMGEQRDGRVAGEA